MDDNLLATFFITFLAGAATSIGAALTFFIKKNDFKYLALGMSFSAGVMLYLSFMDILPMAIEKMGEDQLNLFALGQEKSAKVATLLAFFFGAIIAATIDALIPEHVHSDMLKDCKSADCKKNSRLGRTAIVAAIAVSIHNFPEGLSVFVSGIGDIRVGMAVGFAILLHNIPEGISVSLPIYSATGNKRKAFLIGSLSGLTEPLGALVAYLIFIPILTPTFIGAALALTAGIMVYISLDELLPMAREYGEEHYGIFGAFAGMAVMALGTLVF